MMWVAALTLLTLVQVTRGTQDPFPPLNVLAVSLSVLHNVTEPIPNTFQFTVEARRFERLTPNCSSIFDLGRLSTRNMSVTCEGCSEFNYTEVQPRCADYHLDQGWSLYVGTFNVVTPGQQTNLTYTDCCWDVNLGSTIEVILIITPSPEAIQVDPGRVISDGLRIPTYLFDVYGGCDIEANLTEERVSGCRPLAAECSTTCPSALRLALDKFCRLVIQDVDQEAGDYTPTVILDQNVTSESLGFTVTSPAQFVIRINNTEGHVVSASPNYTTVRYASVISLRATFDQKIFLPSDSVLNLTVTETGALISSTPTASLADQEVLADARTIVIKLRLMTDSLPLTAGNISVSFSRGLAQSCPGPTAPLTSPTRWIFTLEPAITRLTPAFGPEAGGTAVTVAGYSLDIGPNTTIMIGDVPCPVTRRGNVSLMCVTGPAPPGLVGQNLSVILTNTDTIIQSSELFFTYQPNPVIQTVRPLASIVSGGTLVTVTGESLSSVGRPLLEITMVTVGVPVQVFRSDACTVLNQTYMICSTPPIQLPPSSAKRQKRNANESGTFSSYSTQVDVNWFHSYKHGSQQSKRRRFDGNVFSDQRKSRRRRETNETDGGPDVGSRVNREDSNITFFLGFVLDGVSVYRNLSDVLPEYSTVDVYFNPAFFYFEERDNIRAFRPFGSFDDRVLNIEGRDRLIGDLFPQLKVTIGYSMCGNVSMTSSGIVCYPPRRNPPRDASNRYPEVRITIGQYNMTPGYLWYQHNIWEYPPARYGIISGVAFAVLLLLIAALGVAWLRLRSRRREGARGKTRGIYPYKPPLSSRISNALGKSRGPGKRLFKENKDMPVRYSQAINSNLGVGRDQCFTISTASGGNLGLTDTQIPRVSSSPSHNDSGSTAARPPSAPVTDSFKFQRTEMWAESQEVSEVQDSLT